MRVKLYSDFQYFVIFCRRFFVGLPIFISWRIDLSCIQSSNHFFIEIKLSLIFLNVFRSNNTCEYYLRELSQFFSEHGIIHQSSCAWIPQQNEAVERELWQLLEMTMALSFHMQVPKPFWSDTVLTTCYVVNRMPSTVLGGLISHWILHPGQPLFFFLPWAFGGSSTDYYIP